MFWCEHSYIAYSTTYVGYSTLCRKSAFLCRKKISCCYPPPPPASQPVAVGEVAPAATRSPLQRPSLRLRRRRRHTVQAAGGGEGGPEETLPLRAVPATPLGKVSVASSGLLEEVLDPFVCDVAFALPHFHGNPIDVADNRGML